MAAIRKFEDIFAWKEARVLASEIHAVSMRSPFSSDWALRNQMDRAVISVSSNIAEGFERGSDRAFASFLTIARGSVAEVRSQLYLALDFGYVTQAEFSSALERCQRIASAITHLMAYLAEKRSGEPSVHEDGPVYDLFHEDHPDD